MIAEEFLKAYKKMCDQHPDGCSTCPMMDFTYCHDAFYSNPEKVIKTVEEWWQKNKPLTNADWIKQKLEEIGLTVDIEHVTRNCPIPYYLNGSCCENHSISCTDCQKWWDEPHEEENK